MPAMITSAAMLLAGVLQTGALSPFDFWPFAFASFALMLWSGKLLDPKHTLSTKSAFGMGWLVGFGLFASGASWVYVSIHTYGYAHPILAAALTLVFVSGLALFHAFAFFVFAKYRTASILANALLFSAIWILNDVIRSVLLTGFPWLFMGDSQVDGPLREWLPVIGVYGVTFLICLTSALFISFVLQRSVKTASVACLIVVLALGTPVFLTNISWTQPSGGELKVALLQSNIPQELKWSAAQKPKTVALLREMTSRHANKDIIFWPETAIPFLYDRSIPLLNQLAESAIKNELAIVSGIPYRGWDNKLESVVMHNSIISIGEGEGIYHKQKLVPFGEYVPLQDMLRGLIAFFDLPMSDFRPGPSNQTLLKTKGYTVAPFICYEVVYPDFVARHARAADYLLTISNDAWFGSSIGPHQHLQIARTRAVENGKSMIRATNNGVTAIIDHNGRITAKIPQFELAVLEGSIIPRQGQTPYSRFGSWPIGSLCVLVLLAALLHRYTRKKAAL